MLNQKMTKRMFGALALLGAVLIWTAGALAEPPSGIQGEVTVLNKDTNPVPVTIQNPAPVPVQTATEWRVVGVTAGEVNGEVLHDGLLGNAAMHSLCQRDVGPTARACFAAEVKQPISAGSSATGSAWVIRSRNVTAAVSGTDFIAIDGGSGVSATSPVSMMGAVASLDCANHISDSTSTDGQIFSFAIGATFPTSCDSLHPIACCGLVAIPVTTLP